MSMSLPISSSEQTSLPPVCRMLRTKTAFGLLDYDEQGPWELGASTTAVYWCLCTMQTAGPDDLLAHPESCREGRSCYRARD
ncbi:MAG TPA: hypothetical protein VNL70_06090 [Tepidisphaeraceae bacterium]|nr:hypothetical protein [Tepidisphaeraceae bacterium]